MFEALLRKLRAATARGWPAHLQDAWRGEDLAWQFLRSHGYVIVARNYRPRRGKAEIDLIGWDGEQIAFIEVKTRASQDFGEPERAVDVSKRRHLIRAASDYLRRAGIDPARARFDIVSVVLGKQPPEIHVQKDAFSQRSIRGRTAP